MNLRSRRLIVLPVAVICTALAACSTPTTQGFRRVENPQVDASYVAVGADFSKYDRIAAEEMGIFFPSHAAPSVEDQQRARKIFREAFLEQLIGYEVVVGETGPTTLQVQASLIDFTNAKPSDVMSVGPQIRDFTRPGTIIFLMELKDSQSNEVLARAVDSADLSVLSGSPDVPTDWDSLDLAAQRWASLFRAFLDRSLGR